MVEILTPYDPLPLAETIERWVANYPVIGTVYIFGSRVRGDHKPDSDVDISIDFDDAQIGISISGWCDLNERNFEDLKAILPGRLSLHQDHDDIMYMAIRHRDAKIICQTQKVKCIFTLKKKDD